MLQLLPALAATLTISLSTPAPAEVSFKAQVAPLLVRKCLSCHNDKKAGGGLNMTTFARLKQGGKTRGADILAPGDAESSGLLESIRPDAEPRMPYKLPPLAEAEVGLLERWVREGAKFDGPSESETALASLVDPLANLPTVAMTSKASEPATSAAFSPDGKRIAVALGRSVLVFDAAGLLVASLDDHPGPLTSVTFSPDGSRLYAAGGRPGMYGAIAAWSVAEGRRLAEWRGHSDAILSAALSPDGKILATASYDRLAILWDAATGAELRTLREHTDAVHAVAFAPDGKSVATASADRTVKVWDAATGRKRAGASDATAELYALAYSPDGATLYAAGVDRSLRAWDLRGDGAVLSHSAFAHDGPVIRLAVSRDGKTLATAGEDRAIKLWDLGPLRPRATFGGRPDWPMALALSPDGTRLVAGHYDGSIALLATSDGTPVGTLRDRDGTVKRPPPQLSRNATLGPPHPRGGRRGQTVQVRLGGLGVGRSDLVIADDPGIRATILPAAKPDENGLDVALSIAADARLGVHRLTVRTPLGVPASQPFSVEDAPEVAEAAGAESPEAWPLAPLPATLSGTIDRPGDEDGWRFDAEAGEEVVFEAIARTLGSPMNPSLAVLGPDGAVLARSEPEAMGREPSLTFRPATSGRYGLRVGDLDQGGSGAAIYRIRAGRLPRVESLFPLGASPGQVLDMRYDGSNLTGLPSSVSIPSDALEPGEVRVFVPPALQGIPTETPRSLAIAGGPTSVEAEADAGPNDSPGGAEPLGAPGGVSGVIVRPGDADLYRFEAKRGHRVVVEVFGRRLGSPIDPAIEVLDLAGNPVPRAILRPIGETNVAFRDHASGTRSVRLTQWTDFAENDLVLFGRELTKIAELPRNPDDDALLWGTGRGRAGPGERIALLGTTPEHHPLGQPIYKVEVHPPGAAFPPGGLAPVVLAHRNDDGGPAIGKDSRLDFDPPADGAYLVRVEDVRGLGGRDYGYHLLVRDPRPDFRLSVAPENVNVPRGGTVVVQVNAERSDGFEGPIDLEVRGLPAGLSAVASRIEPGAFTASVGITADPTAEATSAPTWSVMGRAAESEGPAGRAHEVDPGGPLSGFLTVTPEPNLKVGFRPARVVIRPGERVEMTLTVERGAAFAGRVPIDVRNLPLGVKVLNIGLNGVLVTEAQTERQVVLYAEPWAEATARPIFAVGSCEAAGTEHSSPAIPLVVEAVPPAARADGAAPR